MQTISAHSTPYSVLYEPTARLRVDADGLYFAEHEQFEIILRSPAELAEEGSLTDSFFRLLPRYKIRAEGEKVLH